MWFCISNKLYVMPRLLALDAYGPQCLEHMAWEIKIVLEYLLFTDRVNINPLMSYLTCKNHHKFLHSYPEMEPNPHSLGQADHVIRFRQQTTAICQKARLEGYGSHGVMVSTLDSEMYLHTGTCSFLPLLESCSHSVTAPEVAYWRT